MRLVVTGTGRSGTGYCAELLRSCGVVCGHEAVFTPQAATAPDTVSWGGYEADCSWLAAPILDRAADVHVVLVTRHPVAVVRSWLELGILDRDDAYTDAIRRHTPRTMRGAMTDRALRHWVSWNLLAAARADEIVRLEDIDAAVVNRWLRVVGHDGGVSPEAVESFPVDVNARDHAKRRIGPLTRRMFDPDLLARSRPVAAMFGYPDWRPV